MVCLVVSAFDPLSVGSLELPNRLAVPAMVTRLSGEDGFVNEPIIERYRRFAEGGVGLIVVEASAIHESRSGPLLRVSSDEFVPGLARVAQACHSAGPAKVFLQIIHFLKIARSGWRQKVADLGVDDLGVLPGLFADAAERAALAGFDGVELHMAHAYTLSSFLSRQNRRRDEYGRTLENRLRLPTAVMKAVRERVGDFPVSVRFNADEAIRRGYSVDDAAVFAARFADLGAVYVSLSVGGKFEDAVHRDGEPLYPYTGFSGDRCMPGSNYPDAVNIWMARSVRRELRAAGHDTPVLGTGKIGSVALADQVLDDESCDIVGMARALLADPYLPAKARDGRADETVRCIYCNVCKSLDGSFKTVVCYLWPAGATQAPRPGESTESQLLWSNDAPLNATLRPGEVRLSWPTVDGEATGYDLMRSTDGGTWDRITACTRTRHLDDRALSGHRYQYWVVPYDSAGRRGQASNRVEVDLVVDQ